MVSLRMGLWVCDTAVSAVRTGRVALVPMDIGTRQCFASIAVNHTGRQAASGTQAGSHAVERHCSESSGTRQRWRMQNGESRRTGIFDGECRERKGP